MNRSWLECLWVSLKLGLSSFGGPVAHLGYFHEVYVKREKWVSEERYAELVSLTQFLPGPGSSQLGAAIGYERAGWAGALGSWLGFTLPSALIMIAFAVGMGSVQEWLGLGWIHGLKVAAIAVVAVAVFGMRQKLCSGWKEGVLAVLALILLSLLSYAWMQPLVIVLGGIAGTLLFHRSEEKEICKRHRPTHGGRWWHSVLPAVGLLAMLLLLPVTVTGNEDLKATGGLLHAGALVFGGGHVVLPLLESSTVSQGLVDKDTFLAGYGVAQAVPGPLFTFGGFLGATMELFGGVVSGGVVGIVAVFLPGMVILAGGLPVWDRLKYFSWANAAVRGANATVVGVLAAALLGMLLGRSLVGMADWALLLILVVALHRSWLPVWLMVVLAALAGQYVI